ncbi:hypothetical protein ABC347_15745 [Sphingomonas sp. 1P06PA]|uniref:hypothetical protein n=1 Tax=Sphingomonas sp. 1P06PA TaxID=554121 RepID=UPI0039A5F551
MRSADMDIRTHHNQQARPTASQPKTVTVVPPVREGVGFALKQAFVPRTADMPAAIGELLNDLDRKTY